MIIAQGQNSEIGNLIGVDGSSNPLLTSQNSAQYKGIDDWTTEKYKMANDQGLREVPRMQLYKEKREGYEEKENLEDTRWNESPSWDDA